MLDRYINWDDVVIKALRRHDENVTALANLREEYDSITEGLGATDYTKDKVHSSADADSSLVNRMLQKSSIEQRIKELMREERQYMRAWNALAEDEQRVLAEFFQRGHRPAQEAVNTLCELYGYERTKIWEMRREAIGRFKRLLVG